MTEAQRLTALLERLRERCAETAENVVYGDQAAHRIRLIELDVAVREYLAAGVNASVEAQEWEHYPMEGIGMVRRRKEPKP